MRASRLTLALESGALMLPDSGSIAVLRPVAATDLSALPKDRLRVFTGYRPDHDYFAAQGVVTEPAPVGQHTAAVIFLPRSRDLGHGLVAAAAAALPRGAPIVIDGQKTDGIDAIWRDLRGRFPVGEAFSKAHGKLFVLDNPGADAFAGWAEAAAPDKLSSGFYTQAGSFSADGIDAGSALLAAALPATLPSRVADLGAGWGYLSQAILSRAGVSEVHLVEAEAVALDCARMNITDPRAQFHWADALTFQPEARFGAVIMNPPFHSGRAAEPSLGVAFIRAAKQMLSLTGTLWMVANRHLPYEETLVGLFRDVTELPGSGGFKILRASHPLTRPMAASTGSTRPKVSGRRIPR